MNKILTEVEIRTDIDNNKFNNYLQEAVGVLGSDIETLRLPTDDNFENASVQMGSRKASVLVPKDWDALRNELHDFIYGDAAE
jgi:hypothetical protein